MKYLTIGILVFVISAIVLISGCTGQKQQSNVDTQIANPASVYCEKQGHTVEIRTAVDGSQAGYCKFSDGTECDEWAYYRGECQPGTPASPANAVVNVTNETLVAPGTTTSVKFDVAISGFAFVPKEATVHAGNTVIWTNDDSVAHKVVADDSSFQSDTLQKGDTFTHTFATAGTYKYHCSVHPSMTGTITVI